MGWTNDHPYKVWNHQSNKGNDTHEGDSYTGEQCDQYDRHDPEFFDLDPEVGSGSITQRQEIIL